MRIRFGLKTLLAATLFLASLLGWIASNKSALSHERKLLLEISGDRMGRRGIRIFHSQCEGENFGKGAAVGIADKTPTWFLNRIAASWDADLFERVCKLQIRSHQLNDDALQLIAQIRTLKSLDYDDGNFTPDGIAAFKQQRPDVHLDFVGSSQ